MSLRARLILTRAAVPVLIILSGWFGPAAAKKDEGVIRDVVYVERDGKPLHLDVHLPPGGASGAPMVLVIHGGGFTGGWRVQMDPLCRAIAAEGLVVFNVQYRLAPGSPISAAKQDVRCALRWIAAYAQEYGGDPGRIGITGESAGGYYCAMALFAPSDRDCAEACASGADQPPPIKAAVLYYGLYDLARAYHASRIATAALRVSLGQTPQQAPELYRELSPLTYLHAGRPPILIQTGTRDYFLAENQDLHDRLQALGEDVEIIVWDKARHGFALYPASWPPASAERTAEFFRVKLGAGER
jgi:acetyl esterase